MSIRGNTVGTLMPRTNYNQTDSSKPDYLVGKDSLDEKIAESKKAGTDAQYTANQALNVGNNALQRSGGKMTGDIDMDGRHILNLPEPSQDTDVVTKSFMENYINTTFLGGEW